MKQETLLRITSLIIALVLCFAIILATYRPQAPCEHKSILTEIQLLKSTILELTEVVKENNKAEAGNREELIRENLIKDQIIADQANQIREFGWLKEASKNIK